MIFSTLEALAKARNRSLFHKNGNIDSLRVGTFDLEVASVSDIKGIIWVQYYTIKP